MSAAAKLGRGMGFLSLVTVALAGGCLIALSPDIALPLIVLLLPGLFAFLLDRSPGCGVARAMLLFQAAACVKPVIHGWYRCAGIDGCMGYLADPAAVVPVWLAGAGAWMLTQILPIGLKLLDDYRIKQRRAALAARREALIEEWGLEDDPRR